MRGFRMLKCLLLLILSLYWTITKAQTLPSTSTAPTPVVHSLCITCQCTGVSIVTVNCENRSLTSVPADGLQELADGGVEVSTIKLAFNKITLVRANDFYSHGEFLTTLDLSDNELTEIEDEAFASTHLKKLFILQLGNNKLKALPVNTFRGLDLKTLDLRNNTLSSVPKALAKTILIENLYIQNNPINNIAHDSFNGIRGVVSLDVSSCGLSAFEACKYEYTFFSRLNTLYLDQNRIKTIKLEHFKCSGDSSEDPKRLVVLRTLSIRDSGVTLIEDKAFEDMIQLQDLSLSGNNLGIFKGQVFHGLTKLLQLDLSHCKITDLKRVVFKELKQLESLYLDFNNISVIHHRDFLHLKDIGLVHINLASSNIQRIDGQPFENLTQLSNLNLESNQLDDRSLKAFGKKGAFHRLQLSHNNMQHVPNLPSERFPDLRGLEMENNSVIEIRSQDLQNMSKLTSLTLRDNNISYIEENAFADTVDLIFLDLDNLKLKHLPTRMHLPNMHIFHIKYGLLESLPEDICQQFPNLQIIEAEHNQITRLPSFKGCRRMESLYFSHNNLTTIDHDTLYQLFYLRLLQLDYNRIENLTEGIFRDTGNLEYLHLQGNNLTSLPKDLFKNTTLLIHLDLSHNQLETLDNEMFLNNAKHLSILELNNNRLKNFSAEVLPETSQLNILNLSSNNLDMLKFPSSGLLWLTEFFVENNFDLYQVPDVVAYPNLTDIKYTYAYHCCIWSETHRRPHAFVDHGNENNTAPPTIIPTPEPLKNEMKDTDDCVGGELTMDAKEDWKILASIFNVTVNFLPNCEVELIVPDDYNNGKEEIPTFISSGVRPDIVFGAAVNCSPGPNELSPCANLIDPWPLRAVVWLLWIVTILGNGTVLFISIATKEKMEVFQFLICCLAFSNFCMGVYLAFLSAVDIRTYGEISFFQSALYWQNGPGCKAAGFIAVFASQLSVFILVLLTLERVYTIRYTFNTNEKGKMNVAIVAAFIAVLLSAMLAALPLFGINSYSEVAVCIPYVAEKWTDKAYIGVLLSLHLVGFLIILFSYVYIFRNICKSPAAQQKKKDITIAAVKIAILIATAFVCWIPIVIIGYLALGGIKTVNSSQAKYLIVLVYPLNAGLNPFIYALFTRQFRQKISVMLRRPSDRVGTLPNSRRFPLKRGSSAFLPNSPRNPSSPMELINLRQSRRSNSLSIHLPAHHTSSPPVQSPPSLSPPPGVYMGRRASLPATFGSSIRTLHFGHGNSQNGSMTSNNSTVDVNAHPFNFAPGYGAASSQVEAEIPVVALPTNLNNSLGGSQDSSNRQLPGIPEEQEDENQSVCSADFHDAQEEVREDETDEVQEVQPIGVDSELEVQPIEVDSELSGTSSNENSLSVSLNSSPTQRKRVTEERRSFLREGTDSAYSGCYSSTPDIAITGHHASPVHSCSLSRRSESFSSYDLAVSDGSYDMSASSTPAPLKKGIIRGATPIPLDDKEQQSDLDTCLNYNSSSHESKDALHELEIAQRTNDRSVSQLSVVGSETSI